MWKIITDNWSQLTLVLTAIGFVTGAFLQNKAKRNEVRFTLYEDGRAKAIMAFFDSYFKAEDFFRTINNHDLLKRNLTSNDMDHRWQPIHKDLTLSYQYLRLYLADEYLVSFSHMYDACLDLNVTLQQYFINVGPTMDDENNRHYQDEYWKHYYIVKARCNDHIQDIGKSFKKLYGQ